ncbi:MAG TPA: universal stress protein [Bryobacteraceae bacterium]|nr:universal stress protein [Bryobacteraceae bacterium]
MPNIDTILCPVDFSEFSEKAYDYAYSLARHYKAKLFILHVVEPLIPVYRGYLSPTFVDDVCARQDADAQEQMQNLEARQKSEKVESEALVQWGFVPDSIISFAEEHKVDLIVMGTHGRRGLDRLTMGSTTERVLRKAPCAVLAVRQPMWDFVRPASLEDPVRLRKVLCCTDFSESSPRALEYAFSLASQYQAEVTVLHVIEHGKDDPEAREQATKCIEEVIPPEVRNWATVVPYVRTGKPYQEINLHATQTQSDLIVMGVRGRNALDIALFGSTTSRVIQLGPCPVLVVRN